MRLFGSLGGDFDFGTAYPYTYWPGTVVAGGRTVNVKNATCLGAIDDAD